MCAASFKLRNILQEWIKTNIDWMMIEAALKGDIKLLKESQEKGAVEYNRAMKWAALTDHIEIITLLRSWGANDFDSAVRKAIRGGSLKSLKLFRKWKVSIDFDKAIEKAWSRDTRSFLLDWKSSSVLL